MPRPAPRRSCSGGAQAVAMSGSCHTPLGACKAQQRGMASDSSMLPTEQHSRTHWGLGHRKEGAMRTVTPAGMAAELGRRQGWRGRWTDVHSEELLLHCT